MCRICLRRILGLHLASCLRLSLLSVSSPLPSPRTYLHLHPSTPGTRIRFLPLQSDCILYCIYSDPHFRYQELPLPTQGLLSYGESILYLEPTLYSVQSYPAQHLLRKIQPAPQGEITTYDELSHCLLCSSSS